MQRPERGSPPELTNPGSDQAVGSLMPALGQEASNLRLVSLRGGASEQLPQVWAEPGLGLCITIPNFPQEIDDVCCSAKTQELVTQVGVACCGKLCKNQAHRPSDFLIPLGIGEVYECLETVA